MSWQLILINEIVVRIFFKKKNQLCYDIARFAYETKWYLIKMPWNLIFAKVVLGIAWAVIMKLN